MIPWIASRSTRGSPAASSHSGRAASSNARRRHSKGLTFSTMRTPHYRQARIERERKADPWQRIQTFWAMLRSAINVALLHSNLVLEMTFFRKSRWHLTNAVLSIDIRHTECHSFFQLKALRRTFLARDKRDLVAAREMPASSAISFTERSFN